MPETGESISVLCACGKKLKAPASAVGRKARCPKCGNVLTIEAPPPPPVEDDALGALYDLADAEKDAAHSNQVDDSPRCPKCAASMSPDAVLCVNCGYDLRTKSKVAAKPVVTKPVVNLDAAKSSKKPKDKMAPEGKFIVGLAASFGLALVGGLIWFLVTWLSGWDIYLVCMIIGVFAGLGMQIGQKGFSTAGGWAAAGVTLLVLLMARLAVVIAVLVPMIKRDLSARHDSGSSAISATDEMDSDDHDELVADVAEDQLRAQKIDPEKATDAQTEVAKKAAELKVSHMTHSQQAAELQRYRDKDEQVARAAAAKAGAPGANGGSSSGSGASSDNGHKLGAAVGALLILIIFFGWKSSIFMLLTLGIAYRTASGSMSG